MVATITEKYDYLEKDSCKKTKLCTMLPIALNGEITDIEKFKKPFFKRNGCRLYRSQNHPVDISLGSLDCSLLERRGEPAPLFSLSNFCCKSGTWQIRRSYLMQNIHILILLCYYGT
jgi:hypothetical protein